MTAALTQDLDNLEAAIRTFIQTMKRPATWQIILKQADVSLDRSAAGILMTLIHSQPATCRLSDLAVRLGIEAPSVTRKVQQLEQQGLVGRRQDEHDRRAVDLYVTPAGHEVVKRVQRAQRTIIGRILTAWSEDDRQTFIRLFEQFSDDIHVYYQTK